MHYHSAQVKILAPDQAYQTVSLGTSVCGGRRMFPNKVKDNIQQTLTYRDSESLTTRLFGGVANRRL